MRTCATPTSPHLPSQQVAFIGFIQKTEDTNMYLIYFKVAQLFCLLVSISSLGFAFRHKKVTEQKEFKFVLFVEICTYISFLCIPTEELIIHGKVPLFRYLSWVLTCPIMLVNLLRVNGVTSLDAFVDVVIMDLLVIVLGIIA